MGATQSTDVAFVPKVWSDHIEAYFDRSMGLSKLALVDRTLTSEPGETANFPYFKAIGDAQEPAQDEGLEVDRLQDDAFSVTVKEIGKAVGWKDKAKKVTANPGGQEGEAQRQIGRVFAEKVDKDIITALAVANTAGYTAGSTESNTASVARLLESKILAFGDKQEQAVAVAMHSLDFLEIMRDSSAGFLKADATHPMFGAPGYQGLLLGMALFVLDTMPQTSNVGTKKSFYHFIFKPNPFGIYMKSDMNPERDRDILARETIVSATMWYGVLNLHGRVNANDKRIARGNFATSVAA